MDDEVQNERLLKLEGSVLDISYKTGQIEANQAHMMAKLIEGFGELKQGHGVIMDKQKALEDRIVPFEQEKASLAKKWDIAKKILIPGIAAMAGFFGTKIGGVVLDAIAKAAH